MQTKHSGLYLYNNFNISIRHGRKSAVPFHSTKKIVDKFQKIVDKCFQISYTTGASLILMTDYSEQKVKSWTNLKGIIGGHYGKGNLSTKQA